MGSAVRRVPARRYRSGGRADGIIRIHVVKKPSEAEERTRKSESSESAGSLDVNTIILAGIERGLTITDIKKMQIGQVVDFVVDYNERQKRADREAEKKDKKRRATQNDINGFLG